MSKTIVEQIQALETRIQADTAKLGQLKQAQAAQAALENIGFGSVVRFVFGRGESRGERTGSVFSIIDTEKGKVIRVVQGDPGKEEIVSIKPADILAVGEEVQEAEAADKLTVTVKVDASEAIAAIETAKADMQSAAADPLANLI